MLRFVAGLTKFKHYEGYLTSAFPNEFIYSGDIKVFFIQCLFEAQTIHHLKSFLKMSQCRVIATLYTPLDFYALGYCLANFHTGVSWEMNMQGAHLSPFISGLRSNMPGIGQSPMSHCADVGKLKSQPFHDLTVLDLSLCKLTNADLVHLFDLIPHMTCLKTLGFCCIEDYDGNRCQHDLLKILQQLTHSNVVSLDISCTGFCSLLKDSPHVYSSALKKLVCPSSGKLEELSVGDYGDVDDGGVLASLVSASSSLKSLELCAVSLSSHESHLKDNTCLTKLTIEKWSEELFPYINKILKRNKTLQHLKLHYSADFIGISMDAIKTISKAISRNNTLRTLEIDTENSILEEIRNNTHKLDKRINNDDWYV